MTDMQDRIAAKVKKILAIAGDDAASDAEVQNAMAHAQRLMDAHHLTESDLAHEPKDDYQRVDEASFNEARAFVNGKFMFAWEHYLAGFVEQFAGVKVYLDHAPKMVRINGLAKLDEKGDPVYAKSVVFYGVAEDAAIAADLFTELRTLIVTMAVGRWGGWARGNGASYCQGFVSGLQAKHSKARLEQKEVAEGNTSLILLRRDDLVKYKKEKAEQWLTKSRGIKINKGYAPEGSRASSEAYYEGHEDGKVTDVEATRRRKLN